MSVQAFYRVQCSGRCARWLSTASVPSGPRALDDVNAAAVFATWGEADEAAAKAGWHDGSNGRFAPCTCHRRDGLPSNVHENDCRKIRPRMVPLCPDCRARADQGE